MFLFFMHQRALRPAGKDGINVRKVASPAGLNLSAEGRTAIGSKRVGWGLAVSWRLPVYPPSACSPWGRAQPGSRPLESNREPLTLTQEITSGRHSVNLCWMNKWVSCSLNSSGFWYPFLSQMQVSYYNYRWMKFIFIHKTQ